MKIKLQKVDTMNDDQSLTLAECGFVAGDVVEVTGGIDKNGAAWVDVIRATEYVKVGNCVSVNPGEYKIVEE